MDSIQKFKKLGILYGVLLAAIGVVLVLYPEKVVSFIGLLLGIFFLGTGLLRCYTLVRTWNERDAFRSFSLGLSILLILLGIFLLLNRNIAVAFISVMIGIFALTSAADRYSVIKVRKAMELPIASTVISGLVHFVFGLVMIAMPLFGASLIIIVTGIYLVAAGIMVILSSCVFFDL